MKADAPRPLRIPPWVPKQVAAIARELSRTGMARSDGAMLVTSEADFQRLLRALTTNPRMKPVWRELSKRQGDGYLHPARSLRKPVADPQGRAMTVLFFHALKIMCDVTLDRVSIASRKEVAEEREWCTNRARTLRTVAEVLLKPTPISSIAKTRASSWRQRRYSTDWRRITPRISIASATAAMR
jgi:hypothetical protein